MRAGCDENHSSFASFIHLLMHSFSKDVSRTCDARGTVPEVGDGTEGGKGSVSAELK